MALLTIVAAVAANGVIGRADGTIPWSLPDDLARFRRITWGRAMIMGRRTFDAIGRPLPGRRTIVVTRNRRWRADGAERADGLEQAIALAIEAPPVEAAPSPDGHSADGPEVIIAGGGEIYRQALPLVRRMRLTFVDAAPDGDVTFPQVSWSDWRQVQREEHPGEDGRPAYTFADYERASAVGDRAR